MELTANHPDLERRLRRKCSKPGMGSHKPLGNLRTSPRMAHLPKVGILTHSSVISVP
jgi:hypothetical protein